MSSSATPAVISASRVLAVAETGTARSANHWPALSGWMIAVPRFSTHNHFHVVFTLPAELAAIALQNKAVVYGILFRTVAETLRNDRRRSEASRCGDRLLRSFSTRGGPICCTIRTFMWSCLGGGLSPDGNRWISCRDGYFLPVQVLSRWLFRRLFTEALERAFTAGQLAFFSALGSLEGAGCFQRITWPWSARPNGRSMQSARSPDRSRSWSMSAAIAHRVAISNQSRILDIEDDVARFGFQWKDYRRGGQQKWPMTLDADEFIRRFLIHVLAERLPADPLLRPTRQPLP